MATKTRIPVIVCGGGIGRAVIFGWVDTLPDAETVCTVYNARMVLYWAKECGGLFGLAANGPAGSSRITSSVISVSDSWRQVIEVSPEAAKSFEEWRHA